MFLGWLFGNIVFGILSDKYGRRKVLFLSSSLVCWLSFASSFVPWYWLYAVFRFFIGFCLGKYLFLCVCSRGKGRQEGWGRGTEVDNNGRAGRTLGERDRGRGQGEGWEKAGGEGQG